MPHFKKRNEPGKFGVWGPAGLLLLLLAARPAPAQSTAPQPNMALMGLDPANPQYMGPRYPGGPDSLRAAVRRGLAAASPALVGQLFLRLELDSAGRSRQAYMLARRPSRSTSAPKPKV